MSEIESLLRERYPAVFSEPTPLAHKIRDVLTDLLKEEVEKAAIKRFLRDWTSRPSYWAKIAAGGPRFNLDGSAAEKSIRPTEQRSATKRLNRLRSFVPDR